ncbi:MAG: beta-mannanase [Akkermansiaceae bacterium]|nr:beta-mannanase [Armatimonadota bacterium]
MNNVPFALAVSALLLLPISGCNATRADKVEPSSAQAAVITTPAVSPAKTIRLEADKAVLTGNTLLQATTGFSGAGYAGDFIPEGAKIVWTIPDAGAGLYDVRVRYSAPFGEKGYEIVVNGKKSSGMLPATGKTFATIPAGKAELVAGTNTVAIERGWGYFQIDSVELTPAKAAPAPTKPPAKLSDPKATAPTRALFATLIRAYGEKTLSGQQDWDDTEYLRSTVARTPAIQGADLIDYSPSRAARGSNPDKTSERLIASAKADQIVTLSWHWNAPTDLIDKEYTDKNGKKINGIWWRGFYTDATTFDLEQALKDPNSPKYKLLVSDIDVIAAELKKFQAAGVPVLWRPLHEAEGGWFWWGAKGPEPLKKLWRILHDRLTVKHGLHNLIWVYSSGTDPKWYPGDDVVDIVGIDQYPTDVGDPLATVWETLHTQYGGRKMIALTEFGGVPDIEKMRRYGVRWGYFASWSGGQGPKKHSKEELSRLYNAPGIMTLKDLPALRKK